MKTPFFTISELHIWKSLSYVFLHVNTHVERERTVYSSCDGETFDSKVKCTINNFWFYYGIRVTYNI